jgi:hypothetical protein
MQEVEITVVVVLAVIGLAIIIKDAARKRRERKDRTTSTNDRPSKRDTQEK